MIKENRKVKFLRVRLYWGNNPDEQFILYIQKRDGGEFTVKDIERLLEEYKGEDEEYNDVGFGEFLEEHGFDVEYIDYDVSLYF